MKKISHFSDTNSIPDGKRAREQESYIENAHHLACRGPKKTVRLNSLPM